MPRFVISFCGLLMCALTGCSSPSSKPSGSEELLSFEIRFHPTNLTASTARRANYRLRVWMQAVEGGIYGPPRGRVLAAAQLSAEEKFSLSLGRIESGLAAAAKKPTVQDDLGSFDPTNTRIARLGTLAVHPGDPTKKYITGLRDPVSGRTLILIYVDRPCTVHARNGDLLISFRGLHWLERIEAPEVATESMKDYRLVDVPQSVVYDVTEIG